MRALVTAAEMRAAEEEAASRGLSSAALMQLAGRGAAKALLDEPGAAQARYLVLAGPGNNGGDALVVAGLLHRAGAPVQIVTYHRKDPSPVDPPAEIPRFDTQNDQGGERLRDALIHCDTVIDGLLGTGRSRPPAPDLAALLGAVREAPGARRVVALDLPTGVNCDTGAADDATLSAELTLTFGFLKRGLLLYPARAHCGAIRVIDIGLPAPPAVDVATVQPEAGDVAAWLPKRVPTVQKYSAGAVLALAGSPHYVGAPILACTSAMRAGAGYVTLASPDTAIPALASRLLEPTMLPLPTQDGNLRPDALDQLREAAGRYRALLVGPGLGRQNATMDLVLRVLAGSLQGPASAVVDADGLFALAQHPDWAERVAIPIVLTPHSGEMARLTGLSSSAIEADRLTVAQEWARRWRQVLVLKGAPTIVASPDGSLSVNPTGNALLATAGTGDVLSGVIAAFLAGGAAPFDAARAAVYIHGLAADLAAPAYGDRGMVAGDLLDLLPRAIHQVLHDPRDPRLP
jgi:hydroxyethylthiazole kinase-like uncharacterized protein yjeF